MSRVDGYTPGRRRVRRRWAPVVLLGISLLLGTGGCEESLPPYAPPEIPLAVQIVIDSSVDGNDLSTVDNGFTVTLTNAGDAGNDFVLLAPYEVEVAITISLVEDPSRSNTVTLRTDFEQNLDRFMHPVEFFLMNIPPRDAAGSRWNWPSFAEEVTVNLQGKVRIANARHDLEINTPRVQTTIVYTEQSYQ